MNENENLVPKRRFKEFKNTGTWEQRKLGEFADISTGKLDANAMVEDGEYDFYTSGMKKYRIDTPAFEGPAITIAGNGATVGYMHLADGEFNAYQRTYVLQNFQANRYFLYSEISKKLPRKIAQEARTGNIPYIVMDMLTELTISLPVLEEEQAKIGAFFKQLDNTIALHQRKVTLLKRLKEAYLTRMLPQNSENIPLLRFADYFDPWEQRKFEDLAESFNYGLNASAMEFDGENKYIRITDIDEYSHRFIQSVLTSPNTDLSNANDYLLKEGDILFARTGASVGKSYQYDPLDGKVYYAGFLIRARIKPEFDSSFIFQNTLTEKYNNFIKITSQRSGQPGVNAQEYANFSIMVPSIGEQVKLGNFFKQLDNAIALHQCKIEKLAEAKKVLLAAMFV